MLRFRPGRRRLGLPLVISAIVLAAVGLWAARSFPARDPLPPTRTAVVTRGPLVVRVHETGTVIPRLAVEVKSKVGGEVVKMAVNEGDAVEAGTLLAQIDQTDFVSRMRQAEADLASARARLSALVEGSRPQEIAQAEAELTRAEIALANARKTERRRLDLFAAGFIARSEVDAAVTERELAEQALVRAREALSLAREGSREQDVVAARAAVVRAEEVLRNAREQLDNTTIRAPISGTVIRRKVNQGEIVTAGNVSTSVGTLIMVLADLNEILVRCKVNEVDVPKIRIGQPAEVRLDAIRGKSYRGEVVRIASAGERDTTKNVVTFEVDVRLLDPDPRVRPDMTAAVDIVVGRADDALLVPTEAVETPQGEAGREVLFVRRGEGPSASFEPVPVTIGLRTERVVEVRSGVEEGAVVRLPELAAPDAAASPERPPSRRGISRSAIH